MFKIEYIVSGFAAIAAWCAVLFAYRSYIISKQSLELAKTKNDAKKTDILAYHADSFSYYDQNLKQKKCIFSIAYTNKSEAADSIVEVYLETYYFYDNSRISHLISPHEQNSTNLFIGNAKPAKLPIIISSRSAVTNWFIFSIPSAATDASRIEKYRVVARNGRKEEAIIESYIMREIEYEKRT